jgi:hypothetical protein
MKQRYKKINEYLSLIRSYYEEKIN